MWLAGCGFLPQGPVRMLAPVATRPSMVAIAPLERRSFCLQDVDCSTRVEERPLRLSRHGCLLNEADAALCSARDRLVLSFVMAYLDSVHLLVQVMISGGYVRDLLLGRESDDLDLTLCLRDVDPEVTVDTIAAGLPAFAAQNPELGIDAVDIVTSMSEASRGKSVDAAQVSLRIGGEEVLVDLMPTIAKEVYDANDRIPRRVPRGTPEQDTNRRDLTIGAMLLEVVRPERAAAAAAAEAEAAAAAAAAAAAEAAKATAESWFANDCLLYAYIDAFWLSRMAAFGQQSPPSLGAAAMRQVAMSGEQVVMAEARSFAESYRAAASAAADAATAAGSLQFQLLDFHGGLDDLATGVLRAPYPRDSTVEEAWALLKLSPKERATAELMFAEAESVFPAGSVEDQQARMQVLYWIKSLRDDPLRLVRALRFSATLQFRVHGAFWRAVPFAVDALRTKVSGARKVAELRKIAKAGMGQLLDFFELAFSPLAFFGEEVAFGDALFGGPSTRSAEGSLEVPERISITVGFNGDAMRAVAAALPEGLSADAQLGAVLAAAIISCDLRHCGPCSDGSISGAGLHEFDEECVLAGPPIFYSEAQGVGGEEELSVAEAEAADERMAAAAALSLREVERACEGLCASGAMLQAAAPPLAIAASLLRPPMPLGQHALFAAAAAGGERGGGGVEETFEVPSASEFAALLRTWELLKLDPAAAGRRLEVGHGLVVALLRTRCAPSTADAIEARIQLLSTDGPQISGRALADLEEVPPHLRGSLIAQLHVLCRLRGERPTLQTSEELRAYLSGPCRGLLGRLQAEWWESSSEGKPAVKEQYSKAASSAWLHRG